ncbi:hypothetical protein DOTSEDRAFT_25536 [Dothistroma septosporum NZE10]|uniref:Uncharacterized protein n=1 Tax=Dothistroma septosporum (strain NZE10 / CBS 128990) TaxID=675120 RepID=M2Y5T6_DOTSN|nr:hypothetical protein DOTSEDRAFT_25536 [Dothistroma septosporum NZE10]
MQVFVAVLTAHRLEYIAHDYSTITSFNDSSETLCDVFDIVTGIKGRISAKHLELKETHRESSRVMCKAMNEWRHEGLDRKWAARLMGWRSNPEAPAPKRRSGRVVPSAM